MYYIKRMNQVQEINQESLDTIFNLLENNNKLSTTDIENILKTFNIKDEEGMDRFFKLYESYLQNKKSNELNLISILQEKRNELPIETLNRILLKPYIIEECDIEEFNSFCQNIKKNKDYIYLAHQIYDRILKTSIIVYDEFNVLSNQMIITDPGFPIYKNDIGAILSGQQIYDIEPGTWCGYYYSWITGNIPNIVIVRNKKYLYKEDGITYDFAENEVIVNHKQLIISDINNFPKSEMSLMYKHFIHNENKFPDITTGMRQGCSYKNGYLFHSGWGNGAYKYLIGKKNDLVVQFIIYLIPE